MIDMDNYSNMIYKGNRLFIPRAFLKQLGLAPNEFADVVLVEDGILIRKNEDKQEEN